MSANKNGFMDFFEAAGHFLQHSILVSFLMILMVFATGVLLLLWMPNQSDLPQLNEGDIVQEDIVAKIAFKCRNMVEVDRVRDRTERDFPQYFIVDPERTNAMLAGYAAMMEEIRRRSDAEKNNSPYEPATSDEATAVFVREMQPYLYSVLSSFVESEDRLSEAAKCVEDVGFRGIVRETNSEKAQPEDQRSDDAGVVISYDEGRTEVPYTFKEIPMPESAAGLTVESLLNLVSDEQRVQLDTGKLKDFFSGLYKDGNLVFDSDLTLQRKKETIEKRIAAIPEKEYEKGEVLIKQDRKLSHADIELYKVYRNQYEKHQLDQRTFPVQIQRAFLVALLVVFSCIFILRVHPELVGNNRSVWLIGFIIIFSMLLNYGVLKMFNQWLLDGRLATRIPLYLAMPLALPAVVIASIYSGRSAIFAGLFVAGVSAVALDLSFPAFTVGLFVCAVSTASVRQVYDIKKFFVRALISCTITMVVSSLIFQQNPGFLTMIREHRTAQVLVCFLGVPLANGLLTASVAFVLIIMLETLLDVTCNMSYLSLIDRNHPLLKKLQMEAPGTYHHSERVALLAEEAANSVGAMSLKAQAYALFHDVGKLASPEMFTENASGRDMFNGKSPKESAAVIRNHVEYGVQLAKKYKLKTPLRRAIACHHGNDFISFFYEKEKERTGKKDPPEEPFRYPGPLPDELETVILMLADCCEAAICSMPDPTEDNVRTLVEKIFNGKLQRKQLDAAPITLEQLAKIRESFLKTLKSMNHTRISYTRHEDKEKES